MMMSIFLGDAGASGTVAGSTTANTGLASCTFHAEPAAVPWTGYRFVLLNLSFL